MNENEKLIPNELPPKVGLYRSKSVFVCIFTDCVLSMGICPSRTVIGGSPEVIKVPNSENYVLQKNLSKSG